MFETLSATELKARLAAGEPLRLLDVREEREWELARLEGATLLPLSHFAEWAGQLDPAGGPYVIYCHHGIRSAHACMILEHMGVSPCLNLAGGIDAWSREVDPTVPLY